MRCFELALTQGPDEETSMRSACLLAGVCVLLSAIRMGHAQEAVDVQLVLATDASGSMSLKERRTQREGYAAAFRHREVIETLLSGPIGKIAATYIEFGGHSDQAVVVPWVVLGDRESAHSFADRIAEAPLLARGSQTSVSNALIFAARQFPASEVSSYRKIIDVSGDGYNDSGPPIAFARDAVVEQGVTINGLAVAVESARSAGGPFSYLFGDEFDQAGLHRYYQENVIGGSGAFVISVDDQSAFGPAIQRKLILEIAWSPSDAIRAATAPALRLVRLEENQLHPKRAH